MRRKLLVALLVLSVLAVTVATLVISRAPQRPPPLEGPWVLGYYVGYLKDDYPVQDVDWEALTHVVVGAALPRPDGTLDTSFFLDDTAGPAWAREVVAEAHDHGRRAVLMLGGENSAAAFAAAASGPNRDRFVEQIVAVADDYGFDGVDLDWEPMQAQHGPDVLALVRQLRAQRPDLELSVPLGPVNVNDPGRTVLPFTVELAGLVDRVNVMTYGMNGGWTNWRSWHSSALSGHDASTPMSVAGSVDAYLAAGVPAARLGLGIGFFGSCMSGVTGPGQSSARMQTLHADSDLLYAQIMTDYYRPDVARWDTAAQVPYLSSATPLGPLGCTYVTYEDERSIAAKARFARDRGLGGAIIWNINGGYLPHAERRDPLMEAVRAGLRP